MIFNLISIFKPVAICFAMLQQVLKLEVLNFLKNSNNSLSRFAAISTCMVLYYNIYCQSWLPEGHSSQVTQLRPDNTGQAWGQRCKRLASHCGFRTYSRLASAAATAQLAVCPGRWCPGPPGGMWLASCCVAVLPSSVPRLQSVHRKVTSATQHLCERLPDASPLPVKVLHCPSRLHLEHTVSEMRLLRISRWS